MKNASKKALLIMLVVATIMVMATGIAFAAPAAVTFEAPDGVDGYSLTVRAGASLGSGTVQQATADGVYSLEPGIYNYAVSGKGLYNVRQLFIVHEEEVATGKTVALATDKMAGNGFEMTGAISMYTEEYYKAAFNMDLTDIYGNPHTGYDFVPAFKEGKALHQITTHGELVTFINKLDKATPNMYVYYIGYSPAYGYSWPVVIFTNEEIPAKASFEKAAAIIAESDKLNVWHQAMIHPNEPASGEGAIVMMQELAGEYGEKVLDDINMIVVPRINPDGAYKYQRANVKQGIDMNRDHMYTQAKEITMLHYAENLIMPEVVFDGHEFTANASANSQGIITNTEDIQVTPASSQNIEPAIRAEAQAVVATLFDDLKETGIRIDHYGTTTNNPIGRAYYGLQNAISVLIETRGIGNGATVLERRTFAQVMAVKSMTDSVWAKADEIKEMVAEARATVIAKGATYDEEDTVILSQTANRDREPDLVSQVMSYDYYGNEKGIVEFGIYHYDTVLRERTRPTAYVIPADYENISEVLRIAKNQAFDYIFVEEGSTIVDLQQYGKVSNTEAYLLDAADVTFEGGAYVFPMDQVQGNVLAMTMEPDVNDSNNYNGTLVQSKVVSADEDGLYPIYRFTLDNPRESIYTGKTEAKITFVAPEGLDMEDLTYTLREGLGTRGTEIPTTVNNTYYLDPGYYNYTVSGKGLYTVRQLLFVSEEDVATGRTFVLSTSKMAGTGFEQTSTITLYTEEYIDAFFSTDDLVDLDGNPFEGYDFAPAFKEGKPEHQVTTHGELLTFINKLNKETPNMYVYQIGYSPAYGYSWPVVIFTNEEIPARATFEEAAAIIADSEKPTVWHQAQIHANEPASGEGAIVMMQKLAGQYGEEVLDTINMVVVPRINPDGSYKYQRANVKQNIDMNRDHMYAQSKEITMLHYAENLIMPEVVFDGHEFSSSVPETGIMTSTEDIEITQASSLNIEENVRDAGQAIVERVFEDITSTGIRISHYGTTANNPIGRAYYGLQNAISVLIETRGIGNGAERYERRVFAQATAVESMTNFVVENAAAIKETVAEARAAVIAKGATYDEEDIVVLQQNNSGQTKPFEWERPTLALDGTVVDANTTRTLYHYDTVVRERTRPTAYVIPADYENISEILRIADTNGFEYFKLDEGAMVLGLQQYGRVSNMEAYLLDAADVQFAAGAYVFPMDQVAGNIIAMTMEPDVNDSNNYNGTLVQSKVVSADENNLYPIYRFTLDNPRESIYTQPYTLKFEVPEGVNVTLRKGVAGHGSTPSASNIIAPNADGSYYVELDPGYYNYQLSGEGYYNIRKMLLVTEEKFDENNVLTITADPGKRAGTGYEPDDTNPIQATRDKYPMWVTDEIEQALFSTDDLVDIDGTPFTGFNTPRFAKADEYGAQQHTKHVDVLDFLNTLDEESDYLTMYPLGSSAKYGHLIPLVVLTKTDISEATSLEEAAAILENDGKPVVYIGAGIHPNEISASEGALAAIEALTGEFGDEILDKINVYSIPRMNPDGSYDFTRSDTASNLDVNRDHMRVGSVVAEYTHYAYNLFQPELCTDHHELYGVDYNPNSFILTESRDMEIEGAGTLNMSTGMKAGHQAIWDEVYEKVTSTGIRVAHYGETVVPPIGRTYYALQGSFSFLVEVRGIGTSIGDNDSFERRVFSHYTAMKSFLQLVAENPDYFVETVAASKAEIAAKGATYDEEDTLVLQSARSGETMIQAVPNPTYYLDGTVADSSNMSVLNSYDTVARSRVRPTAYVIAKDTPGADEAVRILTANGAEYLEIAAGETVYGLQQYFGTSYQSNGRINTADVTEAMDVTFEAGAYVFPMDQQAGTVIGLTMEPDVNDASGYNGSLVQSGVIAADENNYYPIYRFTKDNPRESIYEAPATLVFETPEDVNITLRSGWLGNQSAPTEANIIEPVDTNTYIVDPGVYQYQMSGEGYYNIRKLLVVSEEKYDANNTITIQADPGKRAGNGFEPDDTNETQWPRDKYAFFTTDEMEQKWFSTDNLLDLNADGTTSPFTGFNTPRFAKADEYGAQQITTHIDMLDYIYGLEKDCDYMSIYTLGASGKYGYQIPLVLFTKTDISAAKGSMEDAADIIAEDGKPLVYVGAMVHPNEHSAGEGALAAINALAGEYGEDLLNEINVYVIPRINADGAHDFTRQDTSLGIDLNRDHMAVQSVASQYPHYAYNVFQPELCIDHHELYNTTIDRNTGIVTQTEDLQTDAAGTLNVSTGMKQHNYDMWADIYDSVTSTGLRMSHYLEGETVNPAIGRAYYALQGSISTLIEVRGIGFSIGDNQNYERRVFSQYTAIKAYLNYAAQNADMIKELVAASKAEIVAKGATYDEDDQFVLRSGQSGATNNPVLRPTLTIDGEIVDADRVDALRVYDTIISSRVRPTAYVFDLSLITEENLAEMTRRLDVNGVEYFKLDAGATVTGLEQYARVDANTASLADAADVTFAEGALVVPLDQIAGYVASTYCEPDVYDGRSYKVTFAQAGFITADADNMYPLYRFTQDNPRKSIFQTPATVSFVPYDESLYEVNMEDLTVEVYKGAHYIDSWTWEMQAGDLIEPNADGTYSLPEGIYTYKVWGDGYYTMHKLFNVTEEDLGTNKVVTLETSKRAGTGFEADPELNGDVLIRYTDEMVNAFYSTDTLANFPEAGLGVPSSAPGRAENQFTTQIEMLDYITEYDEACDNMYVFYLDPTPEYGYAWPVILFTTADLSSAKNFEEAAALFVQDSVENGKARYHHQAQVHANETSSGDGALYMIQELTGEYGKDVLAELNVSMIPRINPDGSHDLVRSNIYQRVDMNRDYLYVQAPEIQNVQRVFRNIMPHVCMDGHEFMGYYVDKADGSINEYSEDIEITAASSFNIADEVNALAKDTFVANSFEDLTNEGLRIFHYGTTVNSAISRAYMGLWNTISILVETAGGCGMNGGKYYHERIAYAQAMASKSFINSLIENKADVIAAVENGRQEVVAKGATYNEDDVFVLQHTQNGSYIESPRAILYADGTMEMSTGKFYYHDTAAKTRVRPTGYVIPKGEEWAESVKEKLEIHGIEVLEVNAGVTIADLEQYYLVDTYDNGNIKDAGLREAANVTFANGAYFIPMDQVGGNIVAASMEPDVNDTNNYNGSFVQCRLITADADSNYPIYRFTKDNPRTYLQSVNGAQD